MNDIIPVLMYHSISDKKNFLSVNTIAFEKQMKFLKNSGYQSINFNEINKINKKKIIITFDDGYKDNIANALPILNKYNFKATFFIVTNCISKSNIWDVGTKNYNKMELLNYDDINRLLDSNMSLGSHSCNHKNLVTSDPSELEHEIKYSKLFLEKKFNTKISAFSYPYGKLNKKISNIVSTNYEYAVTTIRSRYNHNVHKNNFIPRLHMSNKISNFKFYIKLNTIYEDIKYNDKQLFM